MTPYDYFDVLKTFPVSSLQLTVASKEWMGFLLPPYFTKLK
jgi:hypothetical protein